MPKRPVRRRRRSPLRGEAERARILEVARDVFVARGYRDATLAEICRIAGVGRGTLYQHFGNKRQMLDAMIEGVAGRIEAALAAQVPIPPPPVGMSMRDAVVGFSLARMEAMLRAVFADEATLRVFVSLSDLDDGGGRLITRIDELILDSIEADFETGQQLGVLRAFDTHAIARFVLGGLQKLLWTDLAEGRSPDLSAITRLVVELELWGLGTDLMRG